MSRSHNVNTLLLDGPWAGEYASVELSPDGPDFVVQGSWAAARYRLMLWPNNELVAVEVMQ